MLSEPVRKEDSDTAEPMHRGLAEGVLNTLGEAVYEWDISTDKLNWSAGAAGLLGVCNGAEISSNRAYVSLQLPDSETSRSNEILSSIEQDHGDGVPYHLQYALSGTALNSQNDVWLEDYGRWFAGANGKPARAKGIVRVITERRASENRDEYLSTIDPLTGLYNRAYLNDRLQRFLKELERNGEAGSFLIVGLEHFDLINSVYGYEAGDAVIQEVADRLQKNLRDADILGRFTGAKLGIIMPETNEKEMLIAGYRINNLLRENVIWTQQGPIAVSISVGGVVMPTYAKNLQEIFMAVHQAVGESRRERNASVVSHRPNPEEDAQRKKSAQTAEQIIQSLKEGRIHLAWQPVVDAHTSRTVFHEALIRIQNPDGIDIIANDFVSIAQRLGLIRLVDHYALDLVLDKLKSSPDIRLSFNVSNETACDPEWFAKLASALHNRRDLAGRLIVEITESHAAESLEEARRFIEDVRGLGCQVALDDFGAGFTSFRNLKSLPFDIIKIDGQFVEDLVNSHVNQRFIRALVGLARLFDAKTVVEWVEDEQTARLLKEWGVDYLQGFRFGGPQREIASPQNHNEYKTA